MTCSHETHETHKATPAAFRRLAYVGRQFDGEQWIELRNCECGSTLSIYEPDPTESELAQARRDAWQQIQAIEYKLEHAVMRCERTATANEVRAIATTLAAFVRGLR